MAREYQDYRPYRQMISEIYPGRVELATSEVAAMLGIKPRTVYDRFPGAISNRSILCKDLARYMCIEWQAQNAGTKPPRKPKNTGLDWEEVLSEIKELFPGRLELRVSTEIVTFLGIKKCTVYGRFRGMIFNGSIGVVQLARALCDEEKKKRKRR